VIAERSQQREESRENREEKREKREREREREKTAQRREKIAERREKHVETEVNNKHLIVASCWSSLFIRIFHSRVVGQEKRKMEFMVCLNSVLGTFLDEKRRELLHVVAYEITT